MDLAKQILSRQNHLENLRANYTDRWQEVADFVCPYRDDIRGNLVKGEAKGKKIFDGTAVSAAVLAADGIHGYHVSPAFPWFKYQMNRKQVNKIPVVMDWLQENEFNMYMVLNRSNFYSEMWSFIYDGFTIGTAVIYDEEDIAEGRHIYECVPPGESYIEENRYGEIDVLHRKRKLTARKLVQMFPDKITEDVKVVAQNDPFHEFEVIHAVYPRDEFDTRKKDSKNKRFASVWLLLSGNTVLRESGFDKFPYHVWRYLRDGKSPYGLSPAMLAMSDIKGINLMSKTIQGAAQLHVEGAYNIPEYLQGKVQLRPRGQNFVKSGDSITRVDTGSGTFPIGIDREQAKQQSIRERFHVDTFLMLSTMQAQSGNRTATEVIEMMAEKAAILGAELGPLNTILDNLLDYTYEIEVNAGRMPEPPDVLFEISATDPNLRFDPQYMGPLAQAQRDRFQSDWVTKLTNRLTPIIQIDSSVVDNIDTDEAARTIIESAYPPSEILRTKDEVIQRRVQRQMAQEQEQRKQDMERFASGAKDMAQAEQASGGSLTESVMGAAIGQA